LPVCAGLGEYYPGRFERAKTEAKACDDYSEKAWLSGYERGYALKSVGVSSRLFLAHSLSPFRLLLARQTPQKSDVEIEEKGKERCAADEDEFARLTPLLIVKISMDQKIVRSIQNLHFCCRKRQSSGISRFLSSGGSKTGLAPVFEQTFSLERINLGDFGNYQSRISELTGFVSQALYMIIEVETPIGGILGDASYNRRDIYT